MRPFSVLFVCTGNICRSPAAEAAFRHHLRAQGLEAKFHHDSAGIAGYHIGEAPDPRTRKSLKARGIEADDLAARKITAQDYYAFDLILAMDRSHYDALKRQAPADTKAEVALYLPYAHGEGSAEVPDPYYGDADGFEYVLDLLEDACATLVGEIGAERARAGAA